MFHQKKLKKLKFIKILTIFGTFIVVAELITLIKKINVISKIKRNINVVFIGNKAGLLETMQEIEKLHRKTTKLILILFVFQKIHRRFKKQNVQKDLIFLNLNI